MVIPPAAAVAAADAEAAEAAVEPAASSSATSSDTCGSGGGMSSNSSTRDDDTTAADADADVVKDNQNDNEEKMMLNLMMTMTSSTSSSASLHHQPEVVERIAASNLNACRQKFDVLEQISQLRKQLDDIDNERRRKCFVMMLHVNPHKAFREYFYCSGSEKNFWNNKSLVLAALRTSQNNKLPRFLRESNRNWWKKNKEEDETAVASSSNNSSSSRRMSRKSRRERKKLLWNIPEFIKNDKDVFLARLKRRGDFINYYYNNSCLCCRHDDSNGEDDSEDDDSDESDSDDESSSSSDDDDEDYSSGEEEEEEEEEDSSSEDDDDSHDFSSSSSSSGSDIPSSSSSSSSSADAYIHHRRTSRSNENNNKRQVRCCCCCSNRDDGGGGDRVVGSGPYKRLWRPRKLHIPACLQHDKEVMMEVVRCYPDIVFEEEIEEEEELTEQTITTMPKEFLNDKDIFLSFLDSIDGRDRIVHGCWIYDNTDQISFADERIVTSQIMQFSAQQIRSNPDLMVEALLKIPYCRGTYVCKSLRNDKNFCMRYAAEASKAAAASSNTMTQQVVQPLKLRHLSQRLRGDIDIVKAYCQLDGTSLVHASMPLRRHCGVIKIACRQNPYALMHTLLPKTKKRSKGRGGRLPKTTLLQYNKKFCIRLFDKNLQYPTTVLLTDEMYAKLWDRKIPPEMRSDRDVAVAASKASARILSKISKFWLDDLTFWICLLCGLSSGQLAQQQSYHGNNNDNCRPEAWMRIPGTSNLKSNYELALMAAQSVFSPSHQDVLFAIASKFPSIIEDRDVVRSVLKTQGGMDIFRRKLLCHNSRSSSRNNNNNNIPLLSDKEFVVELCQLDGCIYEYVTCPILRRDRDVVAAALMESPYQVIKHLSHPIQHLYPDLISQAMLVAAPSSSSSSSKMMVFYECICPFLWYNNRDIALAWVRRGGEYLGEKFPPEYEKDQELFLVIAEHGDTSDLNYADESLFLDKGFMMQLVAVDPYSIGRIGIAPDERDHPLHGDFDLMLTAFSSSSAEEEENGLVEHFLMDEEEDGFSVLFQFGEALRHRLALHKAFLTVLAGITLPPCNNKDPPQPSSATTPGRGGEGKGCCDCYLPLLNQGTETSRAYMTRIVDYMGIDRGEKLRQLRQASLNLARWGY